MKFRKKKYETANVYEAALERTRYLYKSFDTVAVSFSGGKDSTAVLNICIEVARELGRLPVRAIFFDEEAIHPPTIEYVARVRDNPDVALEWYCLPVKHRNACSNEEPFWTCWEESKRHFWVRDMPEWGIKSHPLFNPEMSFQEFCPLIVGRNGVIIQGIRTQESIRRLRVVCAKKNDNFISRQKVSASAYTVYDWSSEDVWKYVTESGCDYNKFYDVLNRTRKFNRFLSQRVCPPFGEEPLRGLWLYAECWPDMWHKMLARAPGVATAWRYSNTDLYLANEKPDSMTWEKYTQLLISNYSEPEIKSKIQNNVRRAILEHKNKTDDSIHDTIPHPLTGASWKFIAKIVQRGDFKDRTFRAMLPGALLAQKKMGITKDQAIQKYGKPARK